MIRSCHPTVAEFFFASHVVLVEGETEHAVLTFLFGRERDASVRNITVVNCLGKGNIPMFQRILNQFGTAYTVVHDSDSPQSKRDDSWQRNAMWTMNEKIIDTLNEREGTLPRSYLIAHVPDFEGQYFGTSLTKDKPFRALQMIHGKEFDQDEKLAPLRDFPNQLTNGEHPGSYSSMGELEEKVLDWVAQSNPENPEQWEIAERDHK